MERFFRYTRHIIAIIIVICSFGFLYMLALKAMPIDNKDVLQLSAGMVLAVLATVSGYYYGSSKDKSDQDKANNQKP